MPISTTLHDVTPFALRGLRWLALSETGYLLAPVIVDDGGGGASQTFGTAGTVACRIDPSGGGELERGERISERTTHRITLAPDTSVDSLNRIEINGERYEITAVRTRTDEPVRILEAAKAS